MTLLRQPFDDLMAAMEVAVRGAQPARALFAMLLGLVATWFVYVPVHEMLHVLGCVATGGTVTRLEIDPWYGGALLERVVPFVVAGGEYAGRLSGFDTHGSDAVYLATDLAPYLLSIFAGVPLLRACRKRARPFLFGAAAVLGLAPFYNIPGDYYEMGSILVTRAASGLGAVEGLRSDDVFLLIETLAAGPAGIGVDVSMPLAAALVGASLLLGILLALLTYAAGARFASAVLPEPTPRGS